jgi:hypothetical protein
LSDHVQTSLHICHSAAIQDTENTSITYIQVATAVVVVVVVMVVLVVEMVVVLLLI